jgi:DNA-binding HxlR family transcriptional regulator
MGGGIMIREYIHYLAQFDVFSHKWTLLLMILLFIYGSSNFSMLKSNAGPITSKVLSQKLKALESSGLVLKRVIVDRPKRVEYALTERGRKSVSAIARFVKSADKKIHKDKPG